MPSNFVLKTMNTVHKAGLAITFGKWGWNPAGMPAIKLYTTGRKSGAERESMLTCPVVDGDTFVIVASRGGDDFHPATALLEEIRSALPLVAIFLVDPAGTVRASARNALVPSRAAWRVLRSAFPECR